jgi:threonyl-tRNA synthetase
MYALGLTKIYRNVMLNLVQFTDEQSGELHGLTRTWFTQDDAHIFVPRTTDEEFKKSN